VIPKISTLIQGPQDIDTLKELLSKHKGRPICVIGMGADASETRVEFPALGSCLTYGYIDSSGAPGQLPAAILRERLNRWGYSHA
jgi:3-dehydroquinate dehydratase-1